MSPRDFRIVCLPVEDVCEAPEDGEHDGEDRPGSHRAEHALFFTSSSEGPSISKLISEKFTENVQNSLIVSKDPSDEILPGKSRRRPTCLRRRTAPGLRPSPPSSSSPSHPLPPSVVVAAVSGSHRRSCHFRGQLHFHWRHRFL